MMSEIAQCIECFVAYTAKKIHLVSLFFTETLFQNLAGTSSFCFTKLLLKQPPYFPHLHCFLLCPLFQSH